MWAGAIGFLGFQFQSNTDLVTASIEVLAIDQSGEGECDTITQFLLVAQTNLAGIVDLSAQSSILIQLELAAQTEFGVVASRSPGQLYTDVQFVGALLEDGTAEFLAIIAINNIKQLH